LLPERKLSTVMAGFIPAIHVFLVVAPEVVDARDKPGHDELWQKRPLIFKNPEPAT